MTEFTFRVPGPPPHELSPNRNKGYSNRQKMTRLKNDMKSFWSSAIVSERNQIRPFPKLPLFTGEVVAEIIYGKPKGGQDWDEDNLVSTIKWGLDQLQTMGIIVDDKLLKADVVGQVRDPDGIGYVQVAIRDKE